MDSVFQALQDDSIPEKYQNMQEEKRTRTLLGKYIHHFGKESFKSDLDSIKKEFKFIYEPEDDIDSSWEKKFAKKYYDTLFKEFCLVDLSKYKDHKVGMRWRLENEVLSGKGQYCCGEVTCDCKVDLFTLEVNFVYKEQGETKQALVKLKLCPPCAKKLKKAQKTKSSKDKKRKRDDEKEEARK